MIDVFGYDQVEILDISIANKGILITANDPIDEEKTTFKYMKISEIRKLDRFKITDLNIRANKS